MLSFFFPSFENDFTPFFMYFALSFEDKRIIPTYITKKKNDIINSVFVIPLNIGAIHINSKNADANKEKTIKEHPSIFQSMLNHSSPGTLD